MDKCYKFMLLWNLYHLQPHKSRTCNYNIEMVMDCCRNCEKGVLNLTIFFWAAFDKDVKLSNYFYISERKIGYEFTS